MNAQAKSVLQQLKESVSEARAEQPSLKAEASAVFRAGREDLWNAMIPAFPDSMNASREMGAPGSPTPQLVTEALGHDVDLACDTIAHEPQPMRSPEPEMER